MSVVTMRLTGDDTSGWTWCVRGDESELFRTAPMARLDLEAALFSIRRYESRRNSLFGSLSDEELFLILDGFFFGGLHDALRASAEEQGWARHLVSPAVPATISSRMYLIGNGEGRERLLVREDGKRRGFILAEGSFDRELNAVLDCLKRGV